MVTVVNGRSVKPAHCCLADYTTKNTIIKRFWFKVRDRSGPTWLVAKGARSHTGRLFPCANDLCCFPTICLINPTTKAGGEEDFSRLPLLLLGSDFLSWPQVPLQPCPPSLYFILSRGINVPMSLQCHCSPQKLGVGQLPGAPSPQLPVPVFPYFSSSIQLSNTGVS